MIKQLSSDVLKKLDHATLWEFRFWMQKRWKTQLDKGPLVQAYSSARASGPLPGGIIVSLNERLKV